MKNEYLVSVFVSQNLIGDTEELTWETATVMCTSYLTCLKGSVLFYVVFPTTLWSIINNFTQTTLI